MATGWLLPLLAGFAILTSGCVGLFEDKTPVEPPTIDDPFVPAATVSLSDDVGDAVDRAWGGLDYGPSCRVGCTSLPTAPAELETPAPWFDITEATFVSEGVDDVRFTLGLAELSEGFGWLDAREAQNRVADYRVCWVPSEEASERCAALEVAMGDAGAHPSATFQLKDDRCGSLFAECGWPIEHEITYGEPGEITFTVPKAFLAYDGEPLAITSLRAVSSWYGITEVLPLWHAAWSFSVAGSYEHGHNAPGWLGDDADVLEPTELELTFTPSEAPFPSAPTARFDAAPGNVWGRGGPSDVAPLDLLSTETWVEGDELVLRYTLASLESWPAYAAHWDTLLAVSGQPLIEMGVRKDTTILEPYGYLGQCIGFHCDAPKEARVPVELEPGTPATMTVRLPADLLGLDRPGLAFNMLWTITMQSEYSLMWGEHDDLNMADIHAMSLTDAHFGATPYVVGGGAPLPLEHGEEHAH